jgi:hypothetical protein
MSRVGLLTIAALVLGALYVSAESHGPTKRLAVPTYGFSLQPPSGWHTALDKDKLPIFVNFPWSKMQAQLRLPPRGAVINIVAWAQLPRRRGDESLAGWSHLDDVRAKPNTVFSERLRFPTSTGISDAIFVSFDGATFGPDDQKQREATVYWTFRGENFGAHLSYLVGDPRGVAYEVELRHVVGSVRPL